MLDVAIVMDLSIRGIVCNWLPRVPGMIATFALSLLGYSENTKHQDVLTEVIVAAARPILRTPASIRASQIATNFDPGVFGRMWVAKCTVPMPEHEYESQGQQLVLGARQAVALAIKVLDHTQSSSYCEIPELVPVEAEWTGYRRGVSHVAWPPRISEREKYQQMISEIADDCTTVLYTHGGAHCLMDPSSHRFTTSSLARDCGGRVLSIRYRLSPQSIFPAALLDALMAYLSLIAPSNGAFNEPIPASQIVLAGDSSGGGLAASLLLLLLTLAREQVTVRFHGRDVVIPNPPCAGLAMTSPWFDVSRALPSTVENTRWDIVAPPPLNTASPPFPPDVVWPTTPPRAETYCTATMVSHPLVSPLAAHAEDWRGVPPVYMCVGWEVIQDEAEVVGRRMHASSLEAIVLFDGYEGMPHCFSMIPWNRNGRRAFADWGAFCFRVTHRPHVEMMRTDFGRWIDKHGDVKEIRLDKLGLTNIGCGYDREKQPLDDKTVSRLMTKSRLWRIGLEEDMIKEWKQNGSVKTLVTS